MDVYYCHKCNQECNVNTNPRGDITCTRCNDSFVEVMDESVHRNRTPPFVRVSAPEENPFGMFPNSPFAQLFNTVMGSFNPAGSSDTTPSRGTSSEPTFDRSHSDPHLPSAGASTTNNRQQMPPRMLRFAARVEHPEHPEAGPDNVHPMADILQQIFANMIAHGVGGGPEGSGGGEQAEGNPGEGGPSRGFMIRLVAGPGSSQGGLPPGLMNPQDYAWGPTGLDNIITALLNQVEEVQHRGLRAEGTDIQRLPMTKVDQKHVDNGTQCTTCMETFNLDEDVAKLSCEHIFHRACIEPWLQRNNTCPICRTQIDPTNWAGPSNPGFADVDELD